MKGDKRFKEKIKGYVVGKNGNVFNDDECALNTSMLLSCEYCKFNGTEECMSSMLPRYVK